jgi:hypothetical protein
MKKKITKCCAQLAIAIIIFNASSSVAFGNSVEDFRAPYVQNSNGMALFSNALNHAVSNSGEAGFEIGFGTNSDVNGSTLIIISVIILLGVIYMFKTFSFLNKNLYRTKKGVVKLPGLVVWMLRYAAITFLLILLFFIFFGRPLNRIIEGLIAFLIFLFIHYIIERWQVEIKDGTIIVTPHIGRKREVPCEEMKEIVVHIFLGGIGYTLSQSNGKKLVKFDSWYWETENFIKELEKYDVSWSNHMVI